MDYLYQAQERFKRQHGPTAAGMHRQTAEARQQMPIVYSTTKGISLSDDAMRSYRLITGFQEGAFVDAYKMLRAQVLQQLRQKGWNVLGVSSPSTQEGKTLTAVNLSLALAMDLAHTVLLVDADLHRPAVHRAFGMEQAQGLSEYLFDNTPLAQLLIHPGVGRFVFLPGGRPIKNSAEAIASPKMAALVHELKHRYPSRLVVFDLPPLLSRADVLGFSSYIDALLLVVEEGRTATTAVEQAMSVLKGSVPILGGILNKSGRTTLTGRAAKRLMQDHSE